MGNESSKAVEVDNRINPSECKSDSNANSISRVPNNSPSSIKNQSTVPILQSFQSQDPIERDEAPSFCPMSLRLETSDLAVSPEPILNRTPVKLSSQQATLTSVAGVPFSAQLSRVSIKREPTMRALHDSSLPVTSPGYAPLTQPADSVLQSPIAPLVLNTPTEIVMQCPVMDTNIPASFKLSTSKLNEQRSVLSQLYVSQTKLKPHAPEFIPRRELYDSNAHDAITLTERTNLEAKYPEKRADISCPLSTGTSPSPQRQNVFGDRGLPPHLSFRDANHLYRPVRIRPPPAEDDDELDVTNASPIIVYPTATSPSEIVRNLLVQTDIVQLSPTPAEVSECNYPTVSTYAEATNLAIQFPAIASEILVQPLSSVSSQKNRDTTQISHAPSRRKYGDTPLFIEPTEPEQPLNPVPPMAVHTYDVPNWAAAPLLPSDDQAQSPIGEPRRNTRSRHRKNESNQNRQGDSDQAYQRFDSQRFKGETSKHLDHSTAWLRPAVLEFHDSPPAHHQPFFKAQNGISGQTYENVVKKVQNPLDRLVAPSFNESQPLQQPPESNFADTLVGHAPLQTCVPSDTSSSPVLAASIQEEATKLLALAKMNNVDLSRLLRLVGSSGMPQARAGEDQFCEQQKAAYESLPGQSAPLPEMQARTEEVIDDRYWNTPHDMLPENSQGASPTVVTSPPSVFVPTSISVSASAISMSTHGRGNSSSGAVVSSNKVISNEPVDSDWISWNRRGGSARATFANGPLNSLARNARSRTSTGDRREAWPRQHVSRANAKYNHDSENVAAFEVVDKLEGGTKGVFLRHGDHISSKAASSRALADTNHHAEQMRNGGFTSEGDGLTSKGGYGTFKALGRRGVGLEQGGGGNSAIGA